ncbi:hypothetical protein [Pedobacter namyangjuensis]|uniref:hypothetical protein n=1 Tax=Pedobacter namyangjuensis TaxID=600626 RepID=UPI00196488C9|nr:hypothetical protein [Pedobacter namyangjuensis]
MKTNRQKITAANIVLAIGGLNGFVSTEVQNSTFVLRISLSDKNPAHRQYENRYLLLLQNDTTNTDK